MSVATIPADLLDRVAAEAAASTEAAHHFATSVCVGFVVEHLRSLVSPAALLALLEAAEPVDVDAMREAVRTRSPLVTNYLLQAAIYAAPLVTNYLLQAAIYAADLAGRQDREDIAELEAPGYGACPRCGMASPDSTRERRPNGDTTCGACGVKTPSSKWARG